MQFSADVFINSFFTAQVKLKNEHRKHIKVRTFSQSAGDKNKPAFMSIYQVLLTSQQVIRE